MPEKNYFLLVLLIVASIVGIIVGYIPPGAALLAGFAGASYLVTNAVLLNREVEEVFIETAIFYLALLIVLSVSRA